MIAKAGHRSSVRDAPQMQHPNGHVPLIHVDAAHLPWNAALCACGAPMDRRAAKCRSCFEAIPSEKVCTGCRALLPDEEFYKRATGERLPRCKACVAAASTKNRGRRLEYCRRHRAKPGYYKGVAARIKRRRATEPQFNLATGVRRLIQQAIRRGRATKRGRTVDLLGCSIEQFRLHLEGQFTLGMTWANWGRGRACWHIDHKVPCAWFDLTDERQLRACFHYTNLQPLWALDNAAKGARRADPSPALDHAGRAAA